MSWTRKEQPHSLDTQPIEGLFFLIGDAIARQARHPWLQGEKLPLLHFLSGTNCEIWGGRDPKAPIVHLDGEMDLPLYHTRDEAFQLAVDLAEQLGYSARKVGENQLELWMD